MRSLREHCGPRLRRGRNANDGGLPLVAFQTSTVWANIVTALVLFLTPVGGLYSEADEEGGAGNGQLADMADEWSELVDDLGGVYCGLYEPCIHDEATAIFVNLVNSTGTVKQDMFA